jgi:hypothetical protein
MKPLVEKKVGPDLMLYDLGEDAVHILNPAARMIYDLHRQGVAVEAIAAALRDAFRVPADQALEEDVRRALQTMASRGVL